MEGEKRMRKRQLNFVVNYRFSAFSAFSAAAGLNLPISLKVCRCDLKCQSCLTSVHPVAMKHLVSCSVQTHVTLLLHWVEALCQEGDQRATAQLPQVFTWALLGMILTLLPRTSPLPVLRSQGVNLPNMEISLLGDQETERRPKLP